MSGRRWRRRGIDLAPVEEAAAIDARLRDLASARDQVRQQVNEVSKRVGALRRDGKVDEAAELQAESRRLGDTEQQLAAETADADAALRELLLRIPNLPSAESPDGADERDNPVVKVVGYDPDGFADHQRVPHWEIGAALGILDNERAVKISGAMFTMQRGLGATLSRALGQLALDRNADAFEEIRPPTLVTTATLTATGQLPKFADDAYAIERDDLWCIPTAEVPLTSMASGEVLAEAELPMRLMAFTPCYRREAGSAGRDTRGMLRTHEFDKVEIFAYTTPEQAPGHARRSWSPGPRARSRRSGCPTASSRSAPATSASSHHRSFDIEVYAPGLGQWLEVSSVSWFSDYQARRANVRYRPEAEGHRAASTRSTARRWPCRGCWAAILEIHRQPDGSVAIPEVLWPYTRGHRVIPAR